MTLGSAAGDPRGCSPLDVVLEATAFSLTSVRAEHFTMEFSTFFFSVVVELWDWASIMPSHYISSLLPGTPKTKPQRHQLPGRVGGGGIPLHLWPEERPRALVSSKSGTPLPANFLAKISPSGSNKPVKFCLHMQKEKGGNSP